MLLCASLCSKLGENTTSGTVFMTLMTRKHVFRTASSAVFAFCLSFAPLQASQGKPLIRKSVVYFTITGNTAEQLEAQLARRGPRISDLGRHPGGVNIHYSGDVSYHGSGSGCSISKSRVILDVKITLPRWPDRRGASRELVALWDTLQKDISRHENHHAEIAADHAHALQATLRSLPPAGSCDAMRKIVADATKQEIKRQDFDQMQFDMVEMANFKSRMQRLMNANTLLAQKNQ
jgi:predicted secreted Zn-dependent protease